MGYLLRLAPGKPATSIDVQIDDLKNELKKIAQYLISESGQEFNQVELRIGLSLPQFRDREDANKPGLSLSEVKSLIHNGIGLRGVVNGSIKTEKSDQDIAYIAHFVLDRHSLINQ